jgi:hypothetical protein
MTDPNGTAEPCASYKAKSTTVEQLFRDGKSKRNGWSLRDTQISTPDRLDRLILILAMAYPLSYGIGPIAQERFKPPAWSFYRPKSLRPQQRGLCSRAMIHELLLGSAGAEAPGPFISQRFPFQIPPTVQASMRNRCSGTMVSV